MRHTVPAGRLRLLRHGLLRVLGLGLLDQRLLVLVFPVDLVHFQLCAQRPLVVEAVEDAECEGGVAEDLEMQGRGLAEGPEVGWALWAQPGGSLQLRPC